MAVIGFVTIGQSPRNDIVETMVPPSLAADIVQFGALDRLSREEIERLGPDETEVPFVTRLNDGTEVLVSKARLMPFMQRAVDSAVNAGATSIVILCTGAFPQITAPVPLIFPDRILQATLEAILPEGKLGVIMPHIDQMELMRSKWETKSRSMIGYAASPYSQPDKLVAIATELEEAGSDLIVLDCMGFTDDMKQLVQQGTCRPVILANRLVGRIIEEISTNPVEARPAQ
jgi:protein AroM